MTIDLPKQFAEAACAAAGVPRDPDGYVGASQMRPREDTCFKKHQFDLLKTERAPRSLPFPIALALLRGTVVHAVLTDLSAKLPVASENNVRMVADDLMLSGSSDFMFHDELGAVVGELKSMRPEQYRYLARPVLKHIYQVHVYMMLSGARRSIIYYVPHSNEVEDDLPAMLKRAYAKAKGLGGPLQDVQRKIAAILSDLGEWKVTKKAESSELGKQFVVEFDEKIATEIRGIMADVVAGVDRREWLSKQLDNCAICPHIVPCYREDTFESCDKRASV